MSQFRKKLMGEYLDTPHRKVKLVKFDNLECLSIMLVEDTVQFDTEYVGAIVELNENDLTDKIREEYNEVSVEKLIEFILTNYDENCAGYVKNNPKYRYFYVPHDELTLTTFKPFK